MKLYEDQQKVIQSLYQKVKQKKSRIIVAAPTGAGKTVLIGRISKDVLKENKKVLILVHLDVLIEQIHETIKKFNIKDIGIIKHGYEENQEATVQIGSIQTLARREWWRNKKFNIIIFDECHVTSFSKIGKEITNIFKKSLIIGFTATPWRTKRNEGMSEIFTEIVTAPLPRELQDKGRLAKMRYYTIPGGDFNTNEFGEEDIKNACDRDEVIEKAVKEKQKLFPGKRTICFCIDIKHAIHVRDKFRERGIKAETVTADTPTEERKKIYNQLKNKEIEVATGVNVFSVGFDVKEIEVGLLLRPTQSYTVHHQQIGRIMRISEGKKWGYILDQAGNCLRLVDAAVPEDIEEYHLDDPIPKGKKKGKQKKKSCPNCHVLLPISIRVCSECGYIFPSKGKVITSGLIEYRVNRNPKRKSKVERKYRSLLRQAKKNNYDPNWAVHTLHKIHKMYPMPGWGKEAIYGGNPTIEDGKDYWGYLTQIAKRNNKPFEWKIQQLKKEFYEDFIEKFLEELKVKQ